jgi:hypothetical protein
VYHFTDLPSFVSGEHLVSFDPHARFLPGITPANPGLKIAFQRAALASQFPDAAAPYLHFGCTLSERFDGTLFRFPLRWLAATGFKPRNVPMPLRVFLSCMKHLHWFFKIAKRRMRRSACA